jgi:dolichol-phosphate mannosyltransferase
VALTAGLDHAKGDAVLTMDSDLQHPPSLIGPMVELWLEGNDVVSAVRQHTDSVGWFKRHSADAFYWLVNRLSDTPIERGACDFCLLSRPAHQALLSLPERHRFLRGMVAWIGYRRVFIPFHAPARAAGESKYTLAKMVRLAMDAVFSFSTAPIRMASRVGTLVMLAAATYFCYVLGRHWILGDLIPGWSSLICTVLLLGGLQLLSIGIVGEYMSRIFEEAKQRPVYLLKPPQTRTRNLESPTVKGTSNSTLDEAIMLNGQLCGIAQQPTESQAGR